MKLPMMKKALYLSIFSSILATSAFANHAGMMESNTVGVPGKFYLGAFGGGGSSNKFDITQFGTAFYFEAAGGPLAVNAFGHTNSQSVWFGGAQAGYQAPAMMINANPLWRIAPAIEFEGYYLGKHTYTGDLTNDTARLDEHDFDVSYKMKRSAFLANLVVNLNPCLVVQPYVGVGIGGALVDISGADATQVRPPEAGVNHYNSKNSDMAPTFAGQIKAGLIYDFNQYVSVFAEYRWLYLGSTHFTFGSTVYPGHPETSNWQVRFGSQRYNFGDVGIRVNL